MAFNIVLNFIFFNLNIEHLNVTQFNFLFIDVFSNSGFFVLNSAKIHFLTIQLQVFKMKRKFGTLNSIFYNSVRRKQGRVDDLQKVERSILASKFFFWRDQLIMNHSVA